MKHNLTRHPYLLLSIIAFSVCQHAVIGEESSMFIDKFTQMNKNSVWRLIEELPLAFPTFHPQGLTVAHEHLFLSSVEVIDRDREQGKGHLFKMSRAGALLGQTTLGEGPLYHPGGIDYDGQWIWASVAAYRPDSASMVCTVNPETMEVREQFRFADHLGAIAHFPDKNILAAVSWGSRRFYRWKTTRPSDGSIRIEDPDQPEMMLNGNHYVDYQDMQRIPGTPFLLCSGLQSYQTPGGKLPALRLGGIDLIHVEEMRAHWQIPVPLRMPGAPAWTQNPFYVEETPNGLRCMFVPEDDSSTLHVFDVEIAVTKPETPRK